jgi:hypothetical protein
MPRAALLQIHARVEGTTPSSWEHPALVQVWGPRWSTYVIPARDVAVFTLARLPDNAKKRQRVEDLANLLDDFLSGRRMTDRETGRGLGIGNAMRYATATGRVLIRWEGARAPTIWTIPPPEISSTDARKELVRRYLHVYGPTTPASFTRWAAIESKQTAEAFDALGPELTPVRTPIGDEWILSRDEPAFRVEHAPAAARLLPSGDAYWLLQGADRELLVPDAKRRDQLWTPRVWPGAVMVEGEIVGTWRRAKTAMTVETWRRLTPAEREAVETEATSLPLPDEGDMVVRWDG